jgi:hypothetical protein
MEGNPFGLAEICGASAKGVRNHKAGHAPGESFHPKDDASGGLTVFGAAGQRSRNFTVPNLKESRLLRFICGGSPSPNGIRAERPAEEALMVYPAATLIFFGGMITGWIIISFCLAAGRADDESERNR